MSSHFLQQSCTEYSFDQNPNSSHCTVNLNGSGTDHCEYKVKHLSLINQSRIRTFCCSAMKSQCLFVLPNKSTWWWVPFELGGRCMEAVAGLHLLITAPVKPFICWLNWVGLKCKHSSSEPRWCRAKVKRTKSLICEINSYHQKDHYSC